MEPEENILTIEGLRESGKIEFIGFDENKDIKLSYKDSIFEDNFYLNPGHIKDMVSWLQRELKRIGE
jgi:hypothetical protein